MLKKAIFLLLVSLVMVPSVSGMEYLHLDDFISMTMENNREMQKAENQVELTKLSLEEIEAEQLLIPSPVRLYQGEKSLELAQKDMELAHWDQFLQGATKYYELLELQHLVQVHKRSAEAALENLRLILSRQQAGVASSLDVLGANSKLLAAQTNLARTVRGREFAIWQAEQAIGQSIAEYGLHLSYETEPMEMSLQEGLDLAGERRTEISRALINLEVAKKEHQLAQADFSLPMDKKKAELELTKAQLELAELRERIEKEVRQGYINIQNSLDRIPLAKQNELEAEEEYRITTARFQADLVSSSQLLDIQANLTQAQTEVVQAWTDYLLTRARFFHTIGFLEVR